MDFKFSKDNADGTDGETSVHSQEKNKQTGLLVVLLILLGGFGYIYFFTGLIRSQEPPPAPPQPPQVVKKPLPARDAAPVSAVKPAEQKVTAAPSAEPASKPAPKPVDTKVAAVPAVKPEPVKPPVKQEPAKAAVAPAVKKIEPTKPAAVPAAKSEPKKAEQVKTEDQKVAAAKPQIKQADPVKKQTAAPKTVGPWTVVVGLYVVEETLAEDMAKVKKAGLTPAMTSGPKRPVAMNRLFYGEYTSKDQAQQAVETLRRTAGSGFSLQRGDKYEVYAGSYAVLSGAQTEQQRLAASGIKVTVRKTQVPLASRKLTAGTFTDRKAAVDVQKKLKAAGVGSPEIE